VEPNFLRYIASKNKPIICSTGLCTLEEINQSLNFLPDYKKYLMLLQCTTDYPAKIKDSNILSMLELKKTTGCLVGYSDHTVNNVSVIAAIAHGAKVIEKHLTLDKSAEGPDQENSYEPSEFEELVSVIRQTEQALGDGVKKPSERELKNIHGMRRGLVAKNDIHVGEKLEFSDFYLKRPANGISLIEFIQLKETIIKKALKKGDFLSSDHIN
jgi:N,N'-diacetyllegionaminate synthase